MQALLPKPDCPQALGKIVLDGRKSGGSHSLAVDGLFICVGQVPGSKPFAGALALDEAGYLIAGEDCKTNVPGVFAAGDCRTKQVRQLTTAAADGSIAALGALEY